MLLFYLNKNSLLVFGQGKFYGALQHRLHLRWCKIRSSLSHADDDDVLFGLSRRLYDDNRWQRLWELQLCVTNESRVGERLRVFGFFSRDQRHNGRDEFRKSRALSGQLYSSLRCFFNSEHSHSHPRFLWQNWKHTRELSVRREKGQELCSGCNVDVRLVVRSHSWTHHLRSSHRLDLPHLGPFLWSSRQLLVLR